MKTSTKYKCLVVDDEVLARQLIQTHLTHIPNLELTYSCSSAIEAGQYLQSNKIDLLFLDIQMPKLNGIDFLKSLVHPPKVILTTAYSEFALEGYELNVIDYLLKPITFERFQKATNKALELFNLENFIKEPSIIKAADTSIVIKSSHQLIKINMGEILYIEGLHKYVKIITKEKKYTSLIGLTVIENELPKNQFYRCHRSFIINLDKINLIEGNQIKIDLFSIPISKNNKEELISKMGKRIG